MSPVESMAAWKPVLWVNDWWLKETIIDGKTGYLIDKEAKIEDIINAINLLTPEKSIIMREECENRAKEFGLESFKKDLIDLVK